MGKMKKSLTKAAKFFRKNWFFLFAIFTYIFFTIYYMGPSTWSCTTTVYGFGDNTAGPIWKAYLPEEQGLLGSYTSMTNAPYGDNLYSPIGYSLILQPLLIGGLAELAGPVCGYNLVNIIGFLTSAILMFGFIFYLTRSRWLALLAGYAVTFTPYYQMKVGGHPSYGYQAIFIGLIWLFYRLIKHKRKRDALYLAVLYAVAIYFDPYFILYATLIILSLGLTWIILNKDVFKGSFWRSRSKLSMDTKRVVVRLGQSAGVVLLLLTPMLFIVTSQGKEINESVAASRGNVLFEAKACSNWPHEYFVPFILHPGLEKLFGDTRYHSINSDLRGGLTCGIGEDSIGLSLVLLIVLGVGAVVLAWEAVNRRRLGIGSRLSYPAKLVFIGIAVVGVAGILISLPPVRLSGVIPTPTYELLSVTSTWRTLTRGYMLVNIALVIIASLLLFYFATHFKKHRKLLIAVFVIIFLGIVLEYQAFKPFTGNRLSTFNYSHNVPSAYSWLSSQRSLGTIAEYPLERSGGESDANSYYLTMQAVHGKRLFNSALSYSPQEEFKDSLKNLGDPQTIPVLRAFGVDAVFVHGVEKRELEAAVARTGARVIYSAPQSQFNLLSHTPTVRKDIINVLDLRQVKADYTFLNLGKGFARNTTIINSVVDWQYEAVTGSKISGTMIQKNGAVTTKNGEYRICFDAKMSVTNERTDLIVLRPDGTKTNLGGITGKNFKRYTLTAKGTQTLTTVNGHNFRLTKLGCSNDE